MRSHIKTKKAFSLVEVILAIGLFSALVLAMTSGVTFAIQSTQIFAIKNKAIFLADEGLEAARSIRNEAFANLTLGTFGLAQTGNKWVLSGSSDVVGPYTRSLVITSIDSTTKQVVSTVSWSSPSAGSESITMYLTNWYRTVAPAWSAPYQAAKLDLTGNHDGTKVAVSGNYAFVVRRTGSPNFHVIDISNSAAPSQVFNTTLSGSLTDIFISGNYAYITSDDGTAEFRIINISTPTAPSVTSTNSLPLLNAANGVQVVGTRAYVTRNVDLLSDELYILDVSNPNVNSPILGSVSFANNANAIYISGNYAYIATSNTAGEFITVNISNPASPTLVDTFNISGSTTCFSANGYSTTVFIGCNDGRVYSFNVTPTGGFSAATLNTSFNATAAVNDIAINPANTIAYIGTSSTTLEFQAINITNPNSLSLLGSLSTVATLNGVAYDPTRDAVVGVSTDNTGEFVIIKTTL